MSNKSLDWLVFSIWNHIRSIRKSCVFSHTDSEILVIITRLLRVPTHTRTLVNWNNITVVINSAHQTQIIIIKNTYTDYEAIHNATYHLACVFIQVIESFIRIES